MSFFHIKCIMFELTGLTIEGKNNPGVLMMSIIWCS